MGASTFFTKISPTFRLTKISQIKKQGLPFTCSLIQAQNNENQRFRSNH